MTSISYAQWQTRRAESKQKSLERKGKIKTTAESDDIRYFEKVVDQSEINLDRLCKAFRRSFEAGRDESQLALTFQNVGLDIKKDFSDWQITTDAFARAHDCQLRLDDLQNKLANLVDSEIVEPWAGLPSTHIAAAKNQKQSFDKVRLRFDAASNHLESLKQKKAAPAFVGKSETDKMRAGHDLDAIAPETFRILAETASICEAEIVTRLCSYFEGLQIYFQKGLEIVNNFIPELREISLQKQDEIQKFIRGLKSNRRVFGQYLEDVIQREGTEIPNFIVAAVQYLEPFIDEVGLFRLSASKADTDALRRRVDEGKKMAFRVQVQDHNAVTGLIKQFLRELPEPITTFKLYRPFIRVSEKTEILEEAIPALKDLISILPKANANLLQYILHFLYKVSQHSQTNKMSSHNLATIFAPVLLGSPETEKIGNTMSITDGFTSGIPVVEFLILGYPQIYADQPLPDYQVKEPKEEDGPTRISDAIPSEISMRSPISRIMEARDTGRRRSRSLADLKKGIPPPPALPPRQKSPLASNTSSRAIDKAMSSSDSDLPHIDREDTSSSITIKSVSQGNASTPFQLESNSQLESQLQVESQVENEEPVALVMSPSGRSQPPPPPGPRPPRPLTAPVKDDPAPLTSSQSSQEVDVSDLIKSPSGNKKKFNFPTNFPGTTPKDPNRKKEKKEKANKVPKVPKETKDDKSARWISMLTLRKKSKKSKENSAEIFTDYSGTETRNSELSQTSSQDSQDVPDAPPPSSVFSVRDMHPSSNFQLESQHESQLENQLENRDRSMTEEYPYHYDNGGYVDDLTSDSNYWEEDVSPYPSNNSSSQNSQEIPQKTPGKFGENSTDEWVECKSDADQTYWYNTNTRESQWENPFPRRARSPSSPSLTGKRPAFRSQLDKKKPPPSAPQNSNSPDSELNFSRPAAPAAPTATYAHGGRSRLISESPGNFAESCAGFRPKGNAKEICSRCGLKRDQHGVSKGVTPDTSRDVSRATSEESLPVSPGSEVRQLAAAASLVEYPL